ncbi:hypothetical protein NADFUDRAFT_51376 [Nadsonia fulvescens var. elongata DSM 6958]|uniref:Carboxymuconolactone decarboxylase-like domain-containing protein n=1 Tax=Nadsonia fulvescens var. elongata DSM 6958 TaxID=857566 RepID=A0A1E3PLA3_9ASCO|nr:hypothetical protein NADFUDRAFT_51376 [Nadsonia fulvescens var. elongata DSM 6958]
MSILTTQRLVHLSTAYPMITNSWYFIAAATLSVCNSPQSVPQILNYIIPENVSPTTSLTHSAISQSSSEHQDQFRKVQKMREALLKSAALGGLPKSINSLIQLKTATPSELRETEIHRQHNPSPNYLLEEQRGGEFWRKTYGKVANRVYEQMNAASPDLATWALNHVYAPLLSYTDILTPKETSFVVIACLIPQDVNPQLKGHLKGGLNNGASREEIMQVRQMSIEISKWCGIDWREEVAKL